MRLIIPFATLLLLLSACSNSEPPTPEPRADVLIEPYSESEERDKKNTLDLTDPHDRKEYLAFADLI